MGATYSLRGRVDRQWHKTAHVYMPDMNGSSQARQARCGPCHDGYRYITTNPQDTALSCRCALANAESLREGTPRQHSYGILRAFQRHHRLPPPMLPATQQRHQ